MFPIYSFFVFFTSPATINLRLFGYFKLKSWSFLSQALPLDWVPFSAVFMPDPSLSEDLRSPNIVLLALEEVAYTQQLRAHPDTVYRYRPNRVWRLNKGASAVVKPQKK